MDEDFDDEDVPRDVIRAISHYRHAMRWYLRPLCWIGKHYHLSRYERGGFVGASCGRCNRGLAL